MRYNVQRGERERDSSAVFGQSLERPGNLTLPNNCLDGTDGIEGTALHRKKGVFGTCFLNRDVKECNKRAAMHEHGQAHGGVSPALLADVASNDQLRQKALDAIDTHVQGELPLEYHAIKVLQDELKVASRRDTAFEIPLPERTREAVLEVARAALADAASNHRESPSIFFLFMNTPPLSAPPPAPAAKRADPPRTRPDSHGHCRHRGGAADLTDVLLKKDAPAMPLLSISVFLPLLGGVLLMALPNKSARILFRTCWLLITPPRLLVAT